MLHRKTPNSLASASLPKTARRAEARWLALSVLQAVAHSPQNLAAWRPPWHGTSWDGDDRRRRAGVRSRWRCPVESAGDCAPRRPAASAAFSERSPVSPWAPLPRRASITSRRLLRAAHVSAGRPARSLALTSAPAASRSLTDSIHWPNRSHQAVSLWLSARFTFEPRSINSRSVAT